LLRVMNSLSEWARDSNPLCLSRKLDICLKNEADIECADSDTPVSI